MARLKLIASAVLALLLLIVVLQNSQAVETRVLFVSFTLPRSVLLFGTAIIGFVLGVLATFRTKKRLPK